MAICRGRAHRGHEFVLEAMRQSGDALQDAVAELKADRELVLVAVRQDGCALQHVVAELKADRNARPGSRAAELTRTAR